MTDEAYSEVDLDGSAYWQPSKAPKVDRRIQFREALRQNGFEDLADKLDRERPLEATQ